LILRLAALRLKQAQGDSVGDMTHEEVAERLCVYRESATAALGELRMARIIAIDCKQNCIPGSVRLQRAAREYPAQRVS
jgi:DNA-binding transcriptional regulator LsrR (DeoR family)